MLGCILSVIAEFICYNQLKIYRFISGYIVTLPSILKVTNAHCGLDLWC